MVIFGWEVSTLLAASGVENRVTKNMFLSFTLCSLRTDMAVFTVAPVSVCGYNNSLQGDINNS